MGAVASLSREATLCALDFAQVAVFLFGFFFLVGWIAEETAKEDPWKKYRTLFVVMAISGVAGEWIADIAVFALSEHLQTISDKEVIKLQFDAQRLATEEADAHRAITDAQRDVANARRDASDARAVAAQAESHLAEANARAAEASAKAEQFRLGIANAEKDAAEANLALVKFKAWRTLTPEQQKEISRALKPFAGTLFDFQVQPDNESLALMSEIGLSLKGADWKREDWSGVIVVDVPGEPKTGVAVGTQGLEIQIAESRLRDFGPRIVVLGNLLRGDGLAVVAHFHPDATYGNRDVIHIVVGAKPQS
jgi:hypothetical protein